MKLSGKAKSIIQSLAAGAASRGSNGERDSEPPPAPDTMVNPIAGLGAERRRQAAADVSRPLDLSSLRNSRAANMDTESAARDARLADILAGVSQTGAALGGSRAPTPDSADYMEYIRRRRGY